MSVRNNMSNTNFTDISGRATERLVQNIPTVLNPRKSVSQIIIYCFIEFELLY